MIASQVTFDTLQDEVNGSMSDLDQNIRNVLQRFMEMSRGRSHDVVCATVARHRTAAAQGGDYLGAYIWSRVLYLLEND